MTARLLPGLCLVCLALLPLSLQAQTVIDLNGGGVRGKTIDDYKLKQKTAERARADSLAYMDHLTRAFNALHDDSLAKAESLFNQALKTRPDAPGNYIVVYNLGLICLAQNRYAEAVERFDDVLRDRPDLVEARYDRAVCYYESGNLTASLQDCQTLLNGDLDNDWKTQVLFLRSAVYSKSHQADLGKLDLEEILRLDPDNRSAMLLLAGALEELGQPQGALSRLNLFVAAYPDDVDGLVARAEQEMRLTQYDAAWADYDAAILLETSRAALYVGRAKAWLALDNKSAARKDLDRAIELGQTRGALTELYRQAQQ